MAAQYYLGVLDYLIIVLTLLISTIIGFQFKSSNQRTGKIQEYFMAGKNMSLLPVIMSSTATMISALSAIGIPAETYKYGLQMWTMSLGMCIGILLSTYIFIPVYFQCGVSTVYEYLDVRFGRPTKYFISSMYIIQMVLWISAVLYSPVLAINAVTNLPIEPTIVVFGAICTIYCAFGGLKAVLWTDVFQIILMFATLLMIFAGGIEDAGGLANVLEHANKGGRLNLFNFRIDLTTRYTFWNGLFQGFFNGLSMYSANQTGAQRIFSLRNIDRAKSALFISCPLITFMYLSTCLHGIILYAVYFLCDPILNKRETGLTRYDQIVPYFLVSKFHSIPGLTGLAVAGIFSGSLTTISSVLNSLSNVTVVDFVHPIFKSLKTNEEKSLLLAKGLSLVYGTIIICTTLSLTKVKSLIQIGFLFTNTFGGPTSAIFALGMLSRKGFGKSVLFGLLAGFAVTMWIGSCSLFGGYVEPPLPVSTSMCASTLNSTYNFLATEISKDISPSTTPTTSPHSDTFFLNKIPHFWIRPIGFFITYFCTYIAIFIADRSWNRTVIPPDSEYLSPVVKFWTKSAGATKNQDENISL